MGLMPSKIWHGLESNIEKITFNKSLFLMILDSPLAKKI